jgi:hypothetical protein
MRVQGKPQSPLRADIVPVQSGLAPADIKPGDVIEFRVTGRSLAIDGEMRIKLMLVGGVELEYGDMTWDGPVLKGEEKLLLVAVRVPKHGNGMIRARVSMSPSSGATFAAEAEYRFGKYAEKKPTHRPEIKKDNKGRAIREYRAN